MPDLTGQIINNRYRVDAFIERGGMADVYKVTDLQMGVPLAMKVLRADLAEDKDFVRRFQKEAQNLASLQHPNIVRFYRLEKVGRMVFMLLDYIDGSTLRGLLADRDAPLKKDEILRWLEPVCRALNYAHLEGRVHCDIKPSNIMIDRKGVVFLSDFGIMRQIDTSTITMEGFGSPAYMAPELIRSEKLSPATDIYSLGIVLYEMLTGGERPFKGDKAATTGTTSEKVRWEQLRLEPPPPSHYNRNISREMDAVVVKCLAKEPGARFQGISEFMNILKRTWELKPLSGYKEEVVSRPKVIKEKKRIPAEGKSPRHENDGPHLPRDMKTPRWIFVGLIAMALVILVWANPFNKQIAAPFVSTQSSNFAKNQISSTNLSQTQQKFELNSNLDSTQIYKTAIANVYGTRTAYATRIYPTMSASKFSTTAIAKTRAAYGLADAVSTSSLSLRVDRSNNYMECSSSLGYGISNFVFDAIFLNPSDVSKGWDYGVLFRDTYNSDQQYRLILDSGSNWSLEWGTIYNPIFSNLLNTKSSQENKIRLEIKGSSGRLFINDRFVKEMVLKITEAGGIRICTGMYSENGKTGNLVKVSNIKISPLG